MKIRGLAQPVMYEVLAGDGERFGRLFTATRRQVSPKDKRRIRQYWNSSDGALRVELAGRLGGEAG